MKLIRLEDAERVVREHGWPQSHFLIEKLRALATDGEGETGLTLGGVPIVRDDNIPYQSGMVAISKEFQAADGEPIEDILSDLENALKENGFSQFDQPILTAARAQLAALRASNAELHKARDAAFALIADNGCDCEDENVHHRGEPHTCLAGRIEAALRAGGGDA